MKIPQTPSKKAVRKDVYDIMQKVLGRELTIDEHTEVRQTVNMYLEDVANYQKLIETPREHHLICSECAAKKTVVGYKQIKNVYKGKRRGFVSE